MDGSECGMNEERQAMGDRQEAIGRNQGQLDPECVMKTVVANT